MEEGREKAPIKKIPIGERFHTPEKKRELEELQEYARAIEDRLRQAFGAAPGKDKISDAADQVQNSLIELAVDAAEFADQYRAFKVGAVLLGLKRTKEGHENPWSILFDANTKPLPNAHKWCAECYLLDRIEDENVYEALALVIVGRPQVDDASKTSQVTLIPCSDLCTPRLLAAAKEGGAITPKTQIITADLRDTRYRKYFNVEDLPRLHKLPHLEID